MAQVGIVMGSDSDMPIMAKAAEILDELGVSYEMTIISAHREPDVFFEYAKTAEAKGFKVIIAGAGMAAHLPGMCAAIFPMPVIGIPIHTKTLSGVDSLYSIVQMPQGIPVATVAINGGANAGIMAAKILAVGDEELLNKIKAYKEELKAGVMKKKDKIENSLKIYPVPKEDAERGKKPFQKLKPYLVLQYLLKETDEAHVADSATIIKYLNDIGIYAERRSIYKDVEVINQVMWLLEKNKKENAFGMEDAEAAIAEDYDDEEIDDAEFEELDEDKGVFDRYRAATPDAHKKPAYRGRYERGEAGEEHDQK